MKLDQQSAFSYKKRFYSLTFYIESIFDGRSQDWRLCSLLSLLKVIARRELILIARLDYIGSAVPTRVRELTGLGTSFITFLRTEYALDKSITMKSIAQVLLAGLFVTYIIESATLKKRDYSGHFVSSYLCGNNLLL